MIVHPIGMMRPNAGVFSFTDDFVTGWTDDADVVGSANYVATSNATNDWNRALKVNTSEGRAYIREETFGGRSALYTGTTLGNNQFAEILIDQKSTQSENYSYFWLYVRADAAGANYYFMRYDQIRVALFKRVSGGAQTQLGSSVTVTITAGHRLRLTANGSAIAIEHHNGSGWATLISQTDSDLTSGQTGFGIYDQGVAPLHKVGEFKTGEV